MAHEIKVTIAAGDQENLERLLTWRVDQLETSYTLSKIQGGTQEEEARDEWARAKDELAKFLNEKQKQRATGMGHL
jgi:phage/plasmid-associated DNA primase